MRLFLVIDETPFYHPDFIADFLRRAEDRVVGAGLVTKVPPKSNIEQYLRKNWRLLRLDEMARLAFRKCVMTAKNAAFPKRRGGRFYSVRAALDLFGVDHFDIEFDANKPQYLDAVRACEPDVVISSNSLIFKQELLDIPSRCCINRHSSLLPAYGGLWPVFQAYRNGELETGVSVHTMELKIDRGVVLAQRAIPIRSGDTLAELYERCFAISADVVLAALEKIRNCDLSPIGTRREPSYFSFPTPDHWNQFRDRGGRFV